MEITAKAVECATVRVADISGHDRQAMLALMREHYDGVTESVFHHDLDEKDAAMIMREPSGAIVGFSTFMVVDLDISGKSVKGFFSGDTIVCREYRRTTAMGVEIGKNFLKTADAFPETLAYWILISKGCRTYRLLPIFFRDWYPRFDRETPESIGRVMDAFGREKYPLQYEPRLRRIIASPGAEVLRSGVADAHEGRMKDPHIRYFTEVNPNYAEGDELVCAAEIAAKNFAPAFRRMLHAAGIDIHD